MTDKLADEHSSRTGTANVPSKQDIRRLTELIVSIERCVAELLHVHHTADAELTDEYLEILNDCISKLEEITGWYW